MESKVLDLIELYDKLVEDDDSEYAAKVLKDHNVKGFTHSLLNKVNLDDFERQDISTLIKILQYIFNNSAVNPPITDLDYDSLYELNRRVNLTELVGSVNPRARAIVSHNYPDLRGTLDKIHFYYEKDKGKEKNKKSMEYWFKQVLTKWLNLPLTPLRDSIRSFSIDLMIMPKYDGVSVIIETDDNFICNRALTRGDTEINEALDLGHIFRGVNFKHLAAQYGITERMGVKLEVVMLSDRYIDYCKEFGEFNNSRAAVVSALKEKNGPSILEYLFLQPLRIQEANGKIHCLDDYSYVLKNQTEYPELIENIRVLTDKIVIDMDKRRIPIDGSVIVILNEDLQKVMGRNEAINKYEFAYKFPMRKDRTTVLDMDWGFGNLGNITPVAVLDPIKCNGNRVDSATLSNIDKFNELDLGPGDEVLITYDIVPYLTVDKTCAKSGNKRFKIPKECPICGKPTYRDGAFLKCGNSHCISKNIGTVLNYIEKMRIKGISDKTVNKFFKEQLLTDIRDVYRLKNFKARISSLDGFGAQSFQNIIDAIDNRRKCTTADMIGSLGIESIAQSTAKKILAIYNLDELMEICHYHNIDRLIDIDGIGAAKAEKFIRGVNANVDIINYLRTELTLVDNVTKQLITFTGFRDGEFKDYLNARGVDVKDSLTDNVELVVVSNLEVEKRLPEDEQSKKYKKALKKGIPVIDKVDYAEQVGYKGILKEG